MSSNIPNGSMTADPVLLAKVKLAGKQVALLAETQKEGVIPADHLADQIIAAIAQLNAELDGVAASVPGVLR
jgi:hypothetical protein